MGDGKFLRLVEVDGLARKDLTKHAGMYSEDGTLDSIETKHGIRLATIRSVRKENNAFFADYDDLEFTLTYTDPGNLMNADLVRVSVWPLSEGALPFVDADTYSLPVEGLAFKLDLPYLGNEESSKRNQKLGVWYDRKANRILIAGPGLNSGKIEDVFAEINGMQPKKRGAAPAPEPE